uniref:Uncharacterized protein n=1 Tax=viral metagenome TaxID=1070528 RepID=A0A6M3X5B0_9ZZZZ
MKDETEINIHGVHIKMIPMVGINFCGDGYQLYNKELLGSLRSKIIDQKTSRKTIEMYNKTSKDLLEIVDHALILLAD